jgi:hypothetical protein
MLWHAPMTVSMSIYQLCRGDGGAFDRALRPFFSLRNAISSDMVVVPLHE